MLADEALLLDVPPVKAGSTGLRVGAFQVKVTPAPGLVKFTRSIGQSRGLPEQAPVV